MDSPTKVTKALRNHWEWIVFILLIIGVSYLSAQYIAIQKNAAPQLYEMILEQTNDILTICFMMPLAWAVVMGKRHVYKGTYKHVVLVLVKEVIILNLFCFAVFFIVNLIVCISYSGIDIAFLDKTWVGKNQLSEIGFSILGASIVSLLLFFIRMLFLSLTMITVNIMTKSEQIGLLVMLCISIIDWRFYYIFDIAVPMGILPIEHSRILYTEACAPMFPGDTRCSFYTTAVYWTVIFISIACILFVQSRRERKG